MAPLYYRDAQAILLAFSLTDQKSFEKLDTWFEDFEEKAAIGNSIKVLVGTKYDLDENMSYNREPSYFRNGKSN